jgi:autotransporter family porin
MFGLTGFSATPFSTPSAFGPVGVTGVAATGGVGSVSINGTADAVVTGLQATASGGVLVFNESISVTGLAATSGFGSTTVSLPTGFTVTGVSASMPMTSLEAGGSLLGGLAFSEEPFATLSDDSLQISFQLGVGASVTGLAATSAVGSVTVTGPANVSVTGIAGTGGVGSVTVDAAGQVDVTGIAATGGVGAVTVTQGTGVNVALTGSFAVGRVGVASATGEIQIQVTGVAATGQVGQVTPFAWNPIVPDQTANWVEIAA